MNNKLIRKSIHAGIRHGVAVKVTVTLYGVSHTGKQPHKSTADQEQMKRDGQKSRQIDNSQSPTTTL